MAKVVCKKCGATGDSKCPVCRNVFPSNQEDAVLSSTLKHEVVEVDGNRWLQIRYFMYTEETEEQAIVDLAQWLQIVQGWPRGVKEFCCNHEWTFAEGEHSDIGCGHDPH